MAKLQAGTVKQLKADTLAGRMDGEFVSLWNQFNDTALPGDTRTVEDRRLMFVAIARGMLTYLQDHQSDIATTEDRADGAGSEHDHQLTFDWE
jgi:hypothetical protein